MKLSSYLADLSGSRKLVYLLALANLFLSILAVSFFFLYSSREVVTRIIPVGMGAEAEIGARAANADYKRSIALYVATMTSSLQPATAPAVIDELSTFFSPSVFREFREQALQIVNDPVYRQAGVVSVFVPVSVAYEASTDRVFVLGSHMLRGAGINRNTSLVYEVTVGIASGRPIITHMKSYQGTVPDSLKALLSRHKGKMDLLPEYAKPLQQREMTPDEAAKEVILDRGDMTSTPSANHQDLVKNDSDPSAPSVPSAPATQR